MSEKNLYFFIGTEVELIKEFFVLKELQDRGITYKIIFSGQNDVTKCVFYPQIDPKVHQVKLSTEPHTKSAPTLFLWFLKTLIKSVFSLRKEFTGLDKTNTYVFVHGDTLSTLMGALIAKLYRLKVVHIEGGYRSHNFLQPFPEEICRYLGGWLADVHFVAYPELLKNVKKRRGIKISTGYNTFIESLNYALEQVTTNTFVQGLSGKKYFILVCHRQENIYNKDFMVALIDAVTKQSERMTCLFVMHKATEVALIKYKLIDLIKNNPNIVITPRLPYFDFVKVLGEAEFVVSDGGGNQQESYYWGKPLLILRNVTEGTEGVNENAILVKGDFTKIADFMGNYKLYKKPRVVLVKKPSKIIVDWVEHKG